METKLYVGNMSYRMTQDELRDVFSEAGTVTDVFIIKDRESGRPKGFAFVTMASPEEAKTAIEMFNGKEVAGRALKVNEARPLEQRSGGNRPGGNRGGGRGGNRGGGKGYSQNRGGGGRPGGGNRGGGRPSGNRGGGKPAGNRRSSDEDQG